MRSLLALAGVFLIMSLLACKECPQAENENPPLSQVGLAAQPSLRQAGSPVVLLTLYYSNTSTHGTLVNPQGELIQCARGGLVLGPHLKTESWFPDVPDAGNYLLSVSSLGKSMYGREFYSVSVESWYGQFNQEVRMYISDGDIHAYHLFKLTDDRILTMRGAFIPSKGMLTRAVEWLFGENTPLMTFASPVARVTKVKDPTKPFDLILFYDATVSPSGFQAMLNGKKIGQFFHPKPDSYEVVPVGGFVKGRNILIIEVQGAWGKEKISETNELVFEAP